MRLPRPTIALLMLAAGLLAPLPAGAGAFELDRFRFAFNAVQGTGDFVSEDGPYLAAYSHGETGWQLEVWYSFNDALALTVAGGQGRFREKNSAEGQGDRYYRQSSTSFRLGVDRFIEFRENAALYFGPGIEWWQGSSQFIGYAPPPDDDVTTPDVTRLSLSGRFGGLIVLTDSFALNGHLGYRFGQASAEGGGAKTEWYPDGYEAAAGLVYAFGGD